jgi:hypothetical protein
VKLGRIQNFKNWSPEMVPDASTTSLGLEYFVNEGDELREAGTERAGDERLTPQRVLAPSLEERLRQAFARYDPVALGGAVGTTSALGLFVATAILLLVPYEPKGPTLSLLGNYLFGYEVTWAGSLLGSLEAGALGLGFGYVLARMINGLISAVETGLRRELQMTRILE